MVPPMNPEDNSPNANFSHSCQLHSHQPPAESSSSEGRQDSNILDLALIPVRATHDISDYPRSIHYDECEVWKLLKQREEKLSVPVLCGIWIREHRQAHDLL